MLYMGSSKQAGPQNFEIDMRLSFVAAAVFFFVISTVCAFPVPTGDQAPACAQPECQRDPHSVKGNKPSQEDDTIKLSKENYAEEFPEELHKAIDHNAANRMILKRSVRAYYVEEFRKGRSRGELQKTAHGYAFAGTSEDAKKYVWIERIPQSGYSEAITMKEYGLELNRFEKQRQLLGFWLSPEGRYIVHTRY